MKLHKKYLFVMMLISIFITCNYGHVFATTIDQQINDVFLNNFNQYDNIIGCAVVNVRTGEIMAAHIFDSAAINGQQNSLSASLTNVIRSISRNLGNMNYDFSWAGIRFDKGVFYLKMLDPDTFIGCFFKPDFNPQEARIKLVNKVTPAIKNILQ